MKIKCGSVQLVIVGLGIIIVVFIFTGPLVAKFLAPMFPLKEQTPDVDAAVKNESSAPNFTKSETETNEAARAIKVDDPIMAATENDHKAPQQACGIATVEYVPNQISTPFLVIYRHNDGRREVVSFMKAYHCIEGNSFVFKIPSQGRVANVPAPRSKLNLLSLGHILDDSAEASLKSGHRTLLGGGPSVHPNSKLGAFSAREASLEKKCGKYLCSFHH